MIEFCGELSNSCKLYVQNFSTRRTFLFMIGFTFLFSVPIAILAVTWHWIISLFELLPILMLVFSSIPKLNAPMKTLKQFLPHRITIENGLINLYAEKLFQSRPLSAVKGVVDIGEWYHITFYFPQKSYYFVCQKDLIVKGTLEDFEKLFKDKIVRN